MCVTLSYRLKIVTKCSLLLGFAIPIFRKMPTKSDESSVECCITVTAWVCQPTMSMLCSRASTNSLLSMVRFIRSIIIIIIIFIYIGQVKQNNIP